MPSPRAGRGNNKEGEKGGCQPRPCRKGGRTRRNGRKQQATPKTKTHNTTKIKRLLSGETHCSDLSASPGLNREQVHRQCQGRQAGEAQRQRRGDVLND